MPRSWLRSLTIAVFVMVLVPVMLALVPASPLSPPVAHAQGFGCRTFGDGYPIFPWTTNVASSGSHIQVEFWNPGEGIEWITLLPTNIARGGNWGINPNRIGDGHVREWSGECTWENIRFNQIQPHIDRRRFGGFDARFTDWQPSGLFFPR